MNHPKEASLTPPAGLGPHLLDAIRDVRAGVGDGLNDFELTCLLQKTALPSEAGFEFLSYSDRFVTLTVPVQDPAGWYPKQGWLLPEKERLAREIADKYELDLCEPPDAQFASHDLPNPRHHLEMSNRWETIILIHPQYLKIRLFVCVDATRQTHASQRPLPLCTALLQDLSALYRK